MIWFACKQCGKRHGRAENLSGTLVFCECGHGNRVPWASTASEPEEAELEAVPVPVPIPPAQSRPRPVPVPVPDEPERRQPEFPDWRRGRSGRTPARRINPNFCLNHDEVASQETCAECRLRFCKACVVTLQGRTLCGPCKNFRIGALSQPARVAPLSIVALIVSLVSGPVTLVLTMFGLGMYHQRGAVAGALLPCMVSLAMPVGGLILGGMALREIERKPHVGGRALATSGVSVALVGIVWTVTVATLVVARSF
jgi:hypothetical protein